MSEIFNRISEGLAGRRDGAGARDIAGGSGSLPPDLVDQLRSVTTTTLEDLRGRQLQPHDPPTLEDYTAAVEALGRAVSGLGELATALQPAE